MNRIKPSLSLLLAASFALPLLGAAPVAKAETYEECVKRVESFKQRRRAGRQVEQLLADVECAALRQAPAVPGNAVPGSGAPSTVIAPLVTPDLPNAAAAARAVPRKISPVPRPQLSQFKDPVPVPDRWRIVDSLGYKDNLLDPYNRNILKGDKPLRDDWFFAATLISDTVLEPRRSVTPVGASSSGSAGATDIFGSSDQMVFSQTILAELVYYKGDTTFRPPDYEFRFTPAINYNRVELDEIQGINADPAEGDTRSDDHVGIQAAFADMHLRNVGTRYDFDSIRVGIQPFTADFRGFLFNDSPFGVRLFGNRENNVFQYNLAWFRRMEKDTNSGLNDVSEDLRDDDIYVANLYWQDLGVLGFTSQFTVLYNRNRETDIRYDNNDFIVRPSSFGEERPKEYDVTYLGYSGDGHIGWLNLSTSLYYAVGTEDPAPFYGDETDISALFAAAEAGIDQDWVRWRVSALYASGDEDPYDDVSQGFDAIFENPLFAGADTSYWIRQNVPLVGGGRVALSGRNGVLNSLRSSKEQGQSNFTNPGTQLLGVGADFDVLPQLRLSFNVNQLWFADTAVLEVARNQGGIDTDIGVDASVAAIWRPWMHQNVVCRLSYAQLIPGEGYQDLYLDDQSPYSLLANLILTY